MRRDRTDRTRLWSDIAWQLMSVISDRIAVKYKSIVFKSRGTVRTLRVEYPYSRKRCDELASARHVNGKEACSSTDFFFPFVYSGTLPDGPETLLVNSTNRDQNFAKYRHQFPSFCFLFLSPPVPPCFPSFHRIERRVFVVHSRFVTNEL